MKRLLFCVLAVLFLAGSAQAALTYGLSKYQQMRGSDGSRTPADFFYQFVNEIETEIEATGLEGGTTLTFSTNGGTFDNATNNTFRFGELSEYLTLTFSENATAWSSSTGVVLMDFGTVVPKSDQILFDPVTDPVGTVEGTVYYDSDDDNLYVRTTAGLVDLTAGAGSVTDLDTAYNGGGTIDVDTDAVTLTVSDTDNNAALILNQNDSTNDPTALSIVMGAGHTGTALTINSQAGGTDITADNWSVTQAGAATFASATITSFYQAAIAAAAAGNANLTIDAAGNGTITVASTSTGDTIFTRAVQLDGNVTLGDAAGDTLTFSGTVNSGITMDDGVTDAPTLTMQDATNETVTLIKKDAGDFEITLLATEDVEIVTGNLAVGNGSPGTAAMDGEDFYVNGASEFDGAVQFDGAVTAASTVNVTGDVTIDDQISGTFAANDEEIAITNTATDITAAALATFIMAAQDNQAYILNLQATPNADADNDFLLIEDNAGDDKFAINQGGATLWTLDAASTVQIDGSTTLSTSAAGVLDVDMSSATTGGEAVNVKVISTVAISETTAAITIDLDDDTAAAASIYGIDIAASDGTGSSVLYGINIANSIETHFKSVLPAAGTWAAVDAAATDNTVATGVLDIEFDTVTADAEAVNIKATHLTGGAGVAAAAIELELDSDSGNAGDILYGLIINATDTTATGKVKGLYVKGAGIDAGIQLDTGYLRIGTGSSPDVTPGDDDAYIEGTLEVDGAVRIDGAITGDGGDALGGYLKTVTNDTDAHAVTVGESGTVLTNAGAGGAAAHTLPAAAIGLEYTFIVMAAQELRVTPAAGDVININGVAADAAEYWTANAAGECLTLIAVDTTNWIAKSYTGTWTQATP